METQTVIERWSIISLKIKRTYFINYFQPISLDSQLSLADTIPQPLNLYGPSVKRPLEFLDPGYQSK